MSTGQLQLRAGGDDSGGEPLRGHRAQHCRRVHPRRVITHLEPVAVQIRLDRLDTRKP